MTTAQIIIVLYILSRIETYVTHDMTETTMIERIVVVAITFGINCLFYVVYKFLFD